MPDQSRKFLIFSLGVSRYALDLKQVAEVGDPPQLWPIPLSSSYYSGALNFHGDIVAALNLALFLGLNNCNQPQKIIVLHKNIASLALLVDTVVMIVDEEDVALTSPLDDLYSAATLSLNDGEAMLLDPVKLVSVAEQCIR